MTPLHLRITGVVLLGLALLPTPGSLGKPGHVVRHDPPRIETRRANDCRGPRALPA
jgi:hypothetical protein